METRYVRSVTGAEVRDQDLVSMSDAGALADDHLLWEMIRTLPGSATPQKGVVPYGVSGWAPNGSLTSTALVHGNVADGKVRVMPFRAVVGSTTLVGTDVLDHMRGIRSGYLYGSSALETEVSVSANASGDPRWTLVYAIVTPDADGDTETIKKKDPTTGVISDSPSTVINVKTTVTVTTLNGSTGASPTKPSLPADGAGNYHIPLAYLWIDTGFTGATAVDRAWIYEVAPVLPIHSSTGAANLIPANQQHKIGGTVDGNQSDASDGSLQNSAYLPPTMVGKEERIILIQRGYSPESHASGDVVDDSIDWRFRYFKYTIHAQSGNNSNTGFASNRATTSSGATGTAALASGVGDYLQTGMGQSFIDDNSQTITVGDSAGTAVYVASGTMGQLGDNIAIYVRNTDGALVYVEDGNPGAQIIIWLEATGPYSNHGTV